MDHPISGHNSMRFINRSVNKLVLILLIIDAGNQFILCTTDEPNRARSQASNDDDLISRITSNRSNNHLSNHLIGELTTQTINLSNYSSQHMINQTYNRLINVTVYNTSSLASSTKSSDSSNESPNSSYNKSSNVKQNNQLNRLISSNNSIIINRVNALNKLTDVNKPSRSVNLSPISLESRETKPNSTIIEKGEQMSFMNRIDKLINLANDQNNDLNENLLNRPMIAIRSNLSPNATSASIKLLNRNSSTPLTSMSSATMTNISNGRTKTSTESTHENETQIIIKEMSAPTRPIIHNQSLSINKTNQTSKEHTERVLVYLFQTNESNNQSLAAQSKRAPHYLEEKYRAQAMITSTISPTGKNERLLDKPTPILDTQPLIEDIDSELNLRALDERLISEEELIHHHHGSSSIEESSYEYSGHHNTHHSNSRHSNKNEQEFKNQTQDSLWFEQNCPKECACDSSKKWELVNGQSHETLNCSSRFFNDYPVLGYELGKHVERLLLGDNNIRHLQIDTDTFHCEKLIELDLSNNQLEQLTINFPNYKHIAHPIVEFHPSHNHHLHENELLKKATSIAQNITLSSANSSIKIDENKTPLASSTTKANITNKQHLFSHCHRLKILMLSGNDLSTLSTGCFRGLKRLRKLYLDNAQIKFIEKNAFLGANELRLLSLRFNLLTTIHSDMFQHMINLRVLDLTGNSLAYLGAGVLNSLVALQALHLGHNKIRQLSFQCFSGLDGLQLLTINSNQLKSVPRFALQPLKKLKIVNMSGNPIKALKEDDFSHSFVQLLLLNHLTQLEHVSRFAFWDLPYLNELQITHCNEFVHLDEQAIVGAPALHRLRLDHNAISQLDDRLLENLARMTIAARRRLKVYLSGNPFLCDCFLRPVYVCARDQHQCKIELPDRKNITCTFRRVETARNETTTIEQILTTTHTDQVYSISELGNSQLPNECAPSFVSVITPMNVTIVRRLRSKFTLSCKAQGVPTPNVYWLQPTGEIHKEKLITRHGHDLAESDLLTSPHAFQNDDNLAIEQTENQLLSSQATAAFLPHSSSVLMSSNSLPSTAHHSSSTLRINHLTTNDRGLYTCIAENRFGLIRSHVQLITQQLKIELEAVNTSTNYITIRWQVTPIFNPPLNEMLSTNESTTDEPSTNSTDPSLTNSTSRHQSLLRKLNIDSDEAIINSKNEQNLNLLDYQLLYKTDSFGADEDKQTSAETLGSERIFESNKFFASYESVQINRQLKSFTVAGLRPGTRYKICIAVRELREPRTNEIEHSGDLFRKRSIRRSFKRSKRNLISVESASYLAIGCLHSETVHAAFYARNILKADKLRLPILLSTAFGTAIKVSLVCSIAAILIILLMSAYTCARQHQRRSAYETPRKTLLSLAGCRRQQSSSATNTSYSTPLHQLSVLNEPTNRVLEIESIYSPLMLARRN